MTVSAGRGLVVPGDLRTVVVPRRTGSHPRRHRFGVLVAMATRECLRDARLLLLVLLLPVLVAVTLAVAAETTQADGPFTVRVLGQGPAADRVVATLGAAGHVLEGGPTGTAVPGTAVPEAAVPEADVTVAVSGTAGVGDGVRVTVTERSRGAAAGVAAAVDRAFPAGTVTAELPGGTAPYDPATFLLPGILPLAVLLLALPGTVAPVVRWRTAGVLRLLVTAGGGTGGLPWALLPVRALLAVVSAATTVLVCAAAGVLRLPAADVPALVLTGALGTSALLAVGLLVASLVRSVPEVRVLLWAGSVVAAVLGGILVPFLALPGPAAAVLGWTPTAVFADAWRALLTGSVPAHRLWWDWSVLLLVAVVALVATEVLRRRQSAPRSPS